MRRPIRVALFPDSYHEVNGVANTARRFETFARESQLPMLVICGAQKTAQVSEGSIKRLEFKRGPLNLKLDKDLRFDVAFLRHYRAITKAIREFEPDVVHVTGPSDVGIAGAMIAHELKIPLAASWHTNLHEYAGKRFSTIFGGILSRQGPAIEKTSFDFTAQFYRLARLLYAPNQELIDQLKAATRKPCFLMSRGVDAEAFSPSFRSRSADDAMIRIGYVGRLTTEKNVRDFADVGKALLEAGIENFQIVFVGQGSESEWLARNVPNALIAGVKKGVDLATAYADFDIFAFPSRTDTFGNVVLEALASGVPAVVTDAGGPKFIVEVGRNGIVTHDLAQFSAAIVELAKDSEKRKTFGAEARKHAMKSSWARVFESVYDAYEEQLGPLPVVRRDVLARMSLVGTCGAKTYADYYRR